jgi:gluconate 5-dehydrogenase
MLTSRKAGELEESAGHLKERGIEALWIDADMSLGRRDRPGDAGCDGAPRPGRHPRQQRRRDLGRAAEDHPLEAWDKVMNLNIRSIFLLSQAIGKHSMIPRKAARSSTSPRSRPGRQQRRHDDGGLQHRARRRW